MPGFSLTIVTSNGGTEACLEILQWKEVARWMPPEGANKFSVFQSENLSLVQRNQNQLDQY